MGKYTQWAQTRKAEIDSKDGLIAELRNNVQAIQDRFTALMSMTMWAELPSGATVHVGDTVRYMLHNYTCIKEHTKALLRAPTNSEYWELVDD